MPRVSCLKCGRSNEAADGVCRWCGARLRAGKVSGKAEKKRRRIDRAEEVSPPADGARPADLRVDEIVCADSAQLLPTLPSESVDLIVTSPPYNFGLDGYDKHKDTVSWDAYFAWIDGIFAECARLLVPGGRIAVVVQPLFSDYVPTHHLFAEALRRHGLLFQAEILWDKHNYNCKYTAWGSWCSPSLPYFKYTWEFIEVFAKGTRKKTGDASRATIEGDDFKRWVYAKWDVAPERRMKEFGNPAMFPEAIVERLIRLFSYRGDLVLDPFNGAGTTTLVARRLERRYLGIDVSRVYCETARRRIEEEARRGTQLAFTPPPIGSPSGTTRRRARRAAATSA